MLHMPGAVPGNRGVRHEDTSKTRGIRRAKSNQGHVDARGTGTDRRRGSGNVVWGVDCSSREFDVLKGMSMTRGVLRAGGWGERLNGYTGLDTLVTQLSHVALNEGSAGPQSLAQSILRDVKRNTRREND